MVEVRNKTTFNGGLIVSIKGEIMVPPSEETPKDLHFLSNLDMVVIMMETLWCFNETIDVGGLDAVEVMKDGEGALFVEAEANLMLDEIGDFTKPDPVTYGELVYRLLDPKNILQNPLLVAQAQVTKFKCGGFVLGMSWNHFVADGISMTEFMKSWGEVTRGLSLSNPPFLDRTVLKAHLWYQRYGYCSYPMGRITKA
ncbi:omega-hydroxypalmitate O-feruloyl transferase-like [Papaver somniferum]|uniref:omega-hydroxypalmitate O-feruloyl transferase-like n=1 Tax=Papaver somniferum TaxID=3469 RepID=UPI000E6FC7AB|nr:omega-hydroxypalmitate O-feruloyl transferase-like [Papaver somniferum]